MLDHTLPAQPRLSPISTQRSPAAPTAAHELPLNEETLRPATRLVVLVPTQVLDDTLLARRIWSLASPRRLEVLYLGLCPEIENEASTRRQLATLAAITRDDWATVATHLAVGGDWMQAVRAIYRTGDLIICHAEQRVAIRGFNLQPLSQVLLNALDAPVCVLAGFCQNVPPPVSNPAAQILSWLFPLFILVAFFILQIRIEQLPKDWAHTALLSLSVIGEFALIGLWSYFTL